ncbi:hypothetical protein [Kutzneria kofuensis]|uniref:Uncharacterized protein n=1 Tax=Kutzneria kofuensis TaxID=103725 RepID=A0A7W9KL45_9PSEU|nr:hypothetical protein [Kutzneria kofuensis]MBB5894569.1 hypothetical protein [Kutzneria kofuensis]
MATTLLTRPAPQLRRDQRALVDAIRRMTGFDAVAVLRGFDKTSRATRDAINEVVREHGGRVIDLTPVPGLGELAAVPPADLVVATNRSLAPAAERCAAYWNVPAVVLGDGAGEHGRLVRTRQPAVFVTREEGGQDVVVRQLRLLGPVTWSDGTAPARPAEELVLKPTIEGMVVTAQYGGTSVTRPASRMIEVEITDEVVAEIDGHAGLVGVGRYEARPTTRPVCRVAVNG